MMALSSTSTALGSRVSLQGTPLSAPSRSVVHARGALKVQCSPDLLGFLKKKGKEAPAKGKGKKVVPVKKGGKRTGADVAAENAAAGWKSASGGGAGFASKSKAYIEVKGKYLDAGYVDEDADFMGKLFGKKKK